MLRVDEVACASENKCVKLGCEECVRNVDLSDVCLDQVFSEFQIIDAKNFKTGATQRCVGFWDKKS